MATINTDKIAQDAINAIAEKIKNLNTLNIIVAGKTGVGKSTLINAIFRDKLAKTGIGKPVTDHMRKITKKNIPLTIYDTRGFELVYDILINCTFFKSYDIIQTRQSEGPLYEIHA